MPISTYCPDCRSVEWRPAKRDTQSRTAMFGQLHRRYTQVADTRRQDWSGTADPTARGSSGRDPGTATTGHRCARVQRQLGRKGGETIVRSAWPDAWIEVFVRSAPHGVLHRGGAVGAAGRPPHHRTPL